MKWIGLTGGIGTGKSSLSQFLKKMGQPVIEADFLVHQALTENPSIYNRVVQHFGKEILDQDKKIDRKRLGKKVFFDSKRLLELESILHPFVQEKTKKEKEKRKKSGFLFCFCEVPILFEKNLEKQFDEIVLVSCREEIQKERVLKRDKMSEEELEMRLKAQMSLKEKKKKAHFFIENEGSLKELEEKAKKLLKELKKKEEGFSFQSVFLFILSFVFFAYFSFLSPVSSEEKKEFFNEVRGLGMGGARVATVNDATAILVNPAALGKIREPVLNAVDPEISLNGETPSIINFHLIRSFNLKEILKEMKKRKGNIFHQKLQIFPSFAFTNFGLGILAKYELNEEILENSKKSNSTPNHDLFLSYVNDLAFATGFSLRFLDGRLKVGGSLRFVNRVEIHDHLNSDEVELTVSSLAREGFGIGKDIGMIFSLPWIYLPSVSAVWRDALDTQYDFLEGFFYGRDEEARKPRKTRQSLDVGVALFPILANRKSLTFSAEFRDVFNASRSQNDKKDIFRKLHIGTELNVNDTFFLRLGMHQRYWAAGFEFNQTLFQWQFSTYGEEVGTKDKNFVDRRFVGKFTVRF